MGVFRDHRYAEVARYYISKQLEWGRRHGVRRYRIKAVPLEKLVVASKALNKLSFAGVHVARLLEATSPQRVRCVLKLIIEKIELSNALIKVVIRTPELPGLVRWAGVGLMRGKPEAWSHPHVTDVIDVPANTSSMKCELTLLLKRLAADPSVKPNRRLVGLPQKGRTT